MTPEATGTVTQGVCPKTGVQQYLLPVVKELLSGTLTLMPKFQAWRDRRPGEACHTPIFAPLERHAGE
jgi:hypothetical protein